MTRPRVRSLSPTEIEEAERAALERFDSDDRPRPPPLLAAKPSERTLEAIEIVRPWTLYKLLHLDTLSVDSLHARRKQRALQKEKRLTIERSRWLKCRDHLRAAIDGLLHPAADELLPALTAADEPYCAFCELFGHTCYTEVERLRSIINWLDVPRQLRIPDAPERREIQRIVDERPRELNEYEFSLFADDLRRVADSAHAHGAGIEPRWKLSQQARANAVRSKWDLNAITRARAKMLDEKLRLQGGWTRDKIVDLIRASETDWIPAPVELEANLRHDDLSTPRDKHPNRLADRFRDLVDPRSNRRR